MNLERWKGIKRVGIVLVIIALLTLLCVPVFFYFRVSTEGRLALREAKNVKLALAMIDIEYYGKGKSIFDPNHINGMSIGVMEQIQAVMENESEVTLVSYNKKEHAVTGFIYNNGSYQVTYHKDEVAGDIWNVAYLLPMLSYQGHSEMNE